jgi:hypothetical protein
MRTPLLVLPLALFATPPCTLPAPGAESPLTPDTGVAVAPGQATQAELVASALPPSPAPRVASTATPPAGAPAAPAAADALPDPDGPDAFAADPPLLPFGLLLEAGAEDEAFAAHYAAFPIGDLARQQHRIDRLLPVLEAQPEASLLGDARLRELALHMPALRRESTWLAGELYRYTHCEDRGQRVPLALATEDFARRHVRAGMQELRVLHVDLERRQNLLLRRAFDALFAAGRFKSYVYEPGQGPLG